jgi:methylphosphotriester-DNA--protein-cysteine methyltransferase
VGFPLFGHSNPNHSRRTERVVAALVRDRRDLARLGEALHPTSNGPRDGVLHAFDRVALLDAALQRTHYDVLVIEPTDADGQSTDTIIRSVRARFPRLSVLGYVIMTPGMSSKVLAFARAGVHELIIAGIDDSAMVLRHALQRASRRCLAEEVFAEISASLPADAATLVRFCLEHANESPSVVEISHALGVHRRTLVNRMRTALLPPPSEMWAWSRVLLAARYLEMPGRSVEWVALTVGYPSANALRNALKRYTGLMPSDLRDDGGFIRATQVFRDALIAAAGRTPPRTLLAGQTARPSHSSALSDALRASHRAVV